MNRELKRVSILIMAFFVTLFVSASLIQVGQKDALANDQRNTRAVFDSYKTQRGPILVNGLPIAESLPVDDQYRFQRTYPSSLLYGNVTGYFTLNQGRTGIEAAMNSYLTGSSGSQFLNNINGILTGQDPKGASVNLTLDPILQQAAWDALGDYTGSVVVTEPSTGKILAMVSKPSFDPNLLASHDTNAVLASYDSLIADPTQPLIDRAIAGNLNPPGSIFKLVVAAAALESGNYTAESTLPNPSSLPLPGTDVVVNNWNRGRCPGAGSTVTIKQALRESCNIPFAELGLLLGRQALLAQAKKFGFNSSFDIPMKTAESTFPVVMDDPQTMLSSFGQFDVRTTPLQMALVSAALANGGKLMAPTLIQSVLDPTLKPLIDFQAKQYSQAVSPATAAALTEMMVDGVDNGLASNARISGIKVAGKTGTAENGVGEPYTLWFTGFAPADMPRYAITVLVENGAGLGQQGLSGPIAGSIAKQVLEAELVK